MAGRRYLYTRAFYIAYRALYGISAYYGIERIVDIRRMPRSHHNPQSNGTALAIRLTVNHFECVHMQALGGLRRAHKDSPNAGWWNQSFRGYADYMQTEEFQGALNALIDMSRISTRATDVKCERS